MKSTFIKTGLLVLIAAGLSSAAYAAPSCILTATPQSGGAPLTLTVTAIAPVGAKFITIGWGDGANTQSPLLVAGLPHTYNKEGSYTATAYMNVPGTSTAVKCSVRVTVKTATTNDDEKLSDSGPWVLPMPTNTATAAPQEEEKLSDSGPWLLPQPVTTATAADPQQPSDTGPFVKPAPTATVNTGSQQNPTTGTGKVNSIVDATSATNTATIEYARSLRVLSAAYTKSLSGTVMSRNAWRTEINNIIQKYTQTLLPYIDSTKVDTFTKQMENEKASLYQIYDRLEIARRIRRFQ